MNVVLEIFYVSFVKSIHSDGGAEIAEMGL